MVLLLKCLIKIVYISLYFLVIIKKFGTSYTSKSVSIAIIWLIKLKVLLIKVYKLRSYEIKIIEESVLYDNLDYLIISYMLMLCQIFVNSIIWYYRKLLLLKKDILP